MDATARDFIAVIVAAGRSTRFGNGLPKVFQALGSSTVLERSVSALVARPGVRGAVLVLAEDERGGPRWDRARSWPGVLDVVAGGESRSDSVWRGLAAAAGSPYVLVHDGARPTPGASLVDSVIVATRRHGAAVPVLGVVDTVKRCEGDWVTGTVDRSELRLAQTPQGFRRDWLADALERARACGLAPTDDAEALEGLGLRVATVPGSVDNRKITTPGDLAEARMRIEPRHPVLRVGNGFDTHRFDLERPLVLGGVPFPGEPGLAGHSDADVVLHAAMDALLGAAALGDIGQHFPPGDPRWAGAASTVMAHVVARMLRAEGYEIVNLDLTLLAERPRIRDRVDEMRQAIATSFSIDARQVGLKATTLEGLGALGRREGLACQAVALLRGGDPGE